MTPSRTLFTSGLAATGYAILLRNNRILYYFYNIPSSLVNFNNIKEFNIVNFN